MMVMMAVILVAMAVRRSGTGNERDEHPRGIEDCQDSDDCHDEVRVNDENDDDADQIAM